MDKEPRTKFGGVFIRFHEVIKLQNSEFSISDVIPAYVQNTLPCRRNSRDLVTILICGREKMSNTP